MPFSLLFKSEANKGFFFLNWTYVYQCKLWSLIFWTFRLVLNMRCSVHYNISCLPHLWHKYDMQSFYYPSSSSHIRKTTTLLYGSKRHVVYHQYTGKRSNMIYLCISYFILLVTIIYELNLKWTCSNPRCLNILLLFPVLKKNIDKVELLFSNLSTTAPFSSRLEAQSHLLSSESNTWSSRHVCWRCSSRRGNEGEEGSEF